MTCGPSSGLHSTSACSQPSIMSWKPPRVPSTETILRSPGLNAGSLDGFDSADGHVIIVEEHAIDLAGVFLQEGFHDGLAFGTGEVAGLGVKDLDVGIEGFAEALGAADCSAGAGGAGEFKDVAAIGEHLVEFCGSSLAFDDHVRANVRGIHGGICRDGAVNDDDRDTWHSWLPEGRHPSRFQPPAAAR